MMKKLRAKAQEIQARLQNRQTRLPLSNRRSVSKSRNSAPLRAVKSGASVTQGKPQREPRYAVPKLEAQARQAIARQAIAGMRSHPLRSDSAWAEAVCPPPDQQVIDGLARLKAQAARINQLSAELETAMFDLKAIANEVNRHWRTAGSPTPHSPNSHPSKAEAPEPIKVCEYSAAVVPYVRQRGDRAFVLTIRAVDLFKAEREATFIAQALRQWARKKQIVAQPDT